MKEFLFVFVGGGLGSACRYAIAILKDHFGGDAIPWHTLIVNIGGSLLIGLLMALFEKMPGHWLTFLMVTGFCGGFTTFSTFSHETFKLIYNGNWPMALVYALISVLSCLLATGVGYLLLIPKCH